MSANEGTRPTPQSLPRLVIPSHRHKPAPEEITTSRVKSFLDFCRKYKRAPITRLPSIPFIPLPPVPSSDPESGAKEDKEEKGEEATEEKPAVPEQEKVLNTLDFTELEVPDLKAKYAELEKAKEQHTHWIQEMQADKRNREALNQCKHWRKAREGLTLEIDMILGRRKIRRDFRMSANHIKGLTNW